MSEVVKTLHSLAESKNMHESLKIENPTVDTRYQKRKKKLRRKILSKGQLISKQNCQAITSSKKQTLDFYF